MVTNSFNNTMNQSSEHRESAVGERSLSLYQAGMEKIQKLNKMSKEELLKLERSYDGNLTFQPVINKTAGEKSETRLRIDELCKKVSSSSALRRYTTHRNSGLGASLKRSASIVSSIESERGGVV